MMDNKLDLPQPEGTAMQTNSPRRTSMLISSKAWVSTSSVKKTFLMASSLMRDSLFVVMDGWFVNLSKGDYKIVVKPEIRRPKFERRPKAETRIDARWPVFRTSGFGLRLSASSSLLQQDSIQPD